MATTFEPFWVWIGNELRPIRGLKSGLHRVHAEIHRTKVRLLPAGAKRARVVTRLRWDKWGKTPDTGQSISEAVSQIQGKQNEKGKVCPKNSSKSTSNAVSVRKRTRRGSEKT